MEIKKIKVDYQNALNYYTELGASDADSLDMLKTKLKVKLAAVDNYPEETEEQKNIKYEAYKDLYTAFYVLVASEKRRQKYNDSKLGNGHAYVSTKKVINSIEDKDTADKARKVIKGVALGALAAAIISAGGCGVYKLAQKNKDTNGQGNGKQETTTSAVGESNTGTESDKTEETTTSVNKAQDLGDPFNKEEVKKRANSLKEILDQNGIINIGTNDSYSEDELIALIQFMNGAYEPSSELDVSNMVTNYLNFVCGIGNCEHIIYGVNYQGGEDSFKPLLEEQNQTFKPFNIVDTMLMGKSKAKPYLLWLESNFNKMCTSTDREQTEKCFNASIQSLAEIASGSGYTLDGVTYRMTDFSGMDDINSGNILQIYAYITEVFRSKYSANSYTYHDNTLGLEDNTATISYDNLMAYFNALCDGTTSKVLKVDDDGFYIISNYNPDGTVTEEENIAIDIGKQMRNFSSVNQVNTMNAALKLYYYDNKSNTVTTKVMK